MYAATRVVVSDLYFWIVVDCCAVFVSFSRLDLAHRRSVATRQIVSTTPSSPETQREKQQHFSSYVARTVSAVIHEHAKNDFDGINSALLASGQTMGMSTGSHYNNGLHGSRSVSSSNKANTTSHSSRALPHVYVYR